MAKVIDLPVVPHFDVTEENLSVKWAKWKKQFDYYIVASGVTDGAQKRALLLHTAGSAVQDIFETLEDTGDTYDEAVEKLQNYFVPKKNLTYERRLFHECVPREGESMVSYVTRLREIAAHCEFGDMRDDLITSHAADRCLNKRLKLRLHQEENLKLDKLIVVVVIKPHKRQFGHFIFFAPFESMLSSAHFVQIARSFCKWNIQIIPLKTSHT